MNNNEILKKIRYIFDLSEKNMADIWALKQIKISESTISSYLKKDDDPSYQICSSDQLSDFLDGFIELKRGKRENAKPVEKKTLNNNLIFLKLKIALNQKSDDVLNTLKTADFMLSEHELSAFFRRPGHKHYRACQDQILRNYLMGLQLQLRPKS